MATIYWRNEDSSLLNYFASVYDIQTARDFCMKKSVDNPQRVYCLYRAQNGSESLMSQYQNGYAFVVTPDEILR
jgi:hypothetical protein